MIEPAKNLYVLQFGAVALTIAIFWIALGKAKQMEERQIIENELNELSEEKTNAIMFYSDYHIYVLENEHWQHDESCKHKRNYIVGFKNN